MLPKRAFIYVRSKQWVTAAPLQLHQILILYTLPGVDETPIFDIYFCASHTRNILDFLECYQSFSDRPNLFIFGSFMQLIGVCRYIYSSLAASLSDLWTSQIGRYLKSDSWDCAPGDGQTTSR